MTRTIEISQNTIEYDYREWDGEMNEADVEHIKGLIAEGYNQGELNTGEEEHRGWWKIQ